MKRPHKSKTIVAFGSGFVAALVALILHYSGAAVLPAEGLGAMWSTVVASALGVVLRSVTGVPIGRDDGDPAERQ